MRLFEILTVNLIHPCPNAELNSDWVESKALWEDIKTSPARSGSSYTILIPKCGHCGQEHMIVEDFYGVTTIDGKDDRSAKIAFEILAKETEEEK